MYRIIVSDSVMSLSTIHVSDFLGAVELFKALLTVGIYDVTLGYFPNVEKESDEDES